MVISIDASLDNAYSENILEVNRLMSNRSTFYAVLPDSSVKCPNCEWDPIAKVSSGKYNGTGPKSFTGKICPVCKAKGRINTPSKRKLDLANVRWGDSKTTNPIMDPHGTIPDGHARVKVAVEDRPLIEKAQYFLVDSIRCTLVGEIRNRGMQTMVITEFYVRKET